MAEFSEDELMKKNYAGILAEPSKHGYRVSREHLQWCYEQIITLRSLWENEVKSHCNTRALIPQNGGLDEVQKADFRLAALEATNRLQGEIGFDEKWRALVEHTIYGLMKDAFERVRSALERLLT